MIGSRGDAAVGPDELAADRDVRLGDVAASNSASSFLARIFLKTISPTSNSNSTTVMP